MAYSKPSQIKTKHRSTNKIGKAHWHHQDSVSGFVTSCQAGEGGLAWAEQFPSSLLDDQGFCMSSAIAHSRRIEVVSVPAPKRSNYTQIKTISTMSFYGKGFPYLANNDYLL
jgi:hypothetical protein